MSVIRSIKEQSDLELQLAGQTFNDGNLKSKLYDIQRRSFGRYDDWLDKCLNEPYWLRESVVAQVVTDSLQYCGEKYFHLWAYCIMPNHVHVLLKHHESAPTLCKILQHHKGFTAIESNRLLGRAGQFWHRETYDHIVRNQEEFYRIARYILNNPVKAKLVKHWNEWPSTFAHPDLWM